MFEQIWHPFNRVLLEEPAQHKRSMTAVRLLAVTLSSSALALMCANGSVANEHTGNNAASIKGTQSEGAIKPTASDQHASPTVEDLPISASVHSDRNEDQDRLVFEFDAPVQHVTHKDGDQLIIWFNQRGQFDLAKVETSVDGHLRRIDAVGDEATRWVILQLAPESHYGSVIDDGGRRLIIDLASGEHRRANPSTANVKRHAALPNKHLSDNWAPRRRPAPEQQAIKQENAVPSEKIDQAPTLGKPKTLTNRVNQADPEVNVAAIKKRPDIREEAKPATKARLDVAAPGQFEVDELALDRALERTLTREGAVLLPFGMVEFEPGISYVRREFDAPALINLFGFPAFGENVVRRNEVSATLAARIGLPLDSQFELDVPYRYVDQSSTTMIGFNALEETDDRVAAFGDIGVSLAKTFLREDRWWPDAVARIRWNSGTGKTAKDGVALGGGAHELTGSVSVVKSQDPLAFFGSLAYEKTFEENDIDRGDRIGISVGTVLAASPDTSLRASLQQDFIGDAEVDGDKIAGSDRLAASLRLGASSVLGKGILLDASVDVGLTEDAPDYAARIALPIRFNPSGYFSFDDQGSGDGPKENEDEKASP